MSKIVLITGSSTGFGRATAETMAQRGYTVIATMRDSKGRNATHCETLRSLARSEKLPLHVLDLDVTNDDSVNTAVGQALAITGRIDAVINNAGFAALGITEAYTSEQWQQIFEVNVFGVARVNRAVLPAMRRQRSGLLIHVSSAAGRASIAYLGLYCASKFALEALADAYRFELAPFGVDSVLIEPGVHKTPILENFRRHADETRAAECQAGADYSDRVQSFFHTQNASPETPGTAEVVDAFIHLIETPAGKRPFRTVPTPAMQPLLEPYNMAAADLRETLVHIFNIPELAALHKSATAGQ